MDGYGGMGAQETSIFVGGVSWEATVEQLEALFAGRYKSITSVKLIPDPTFTGRCVYYRPKTLT
jgi:RNA recognition motif-containing protein